MFERESKMYLYGIIGILILIILGMTWVWYIQPKKESKSTDRTIESLKEEFETSYHPFIDDISEYEDSYDACKVLLNTIQTITEEKSLIQQEAIKAKELQVKTSIGLEQKSHEIIHISHQMRTSLSGLLGFTQFLKDTDLNEEQEEFVSIITTSSNELLTLVNGIIDMTPKTRTDNEEATSTALEKAKKHSKPNVLVVDDNDINKKLLAKVLENEDLEVTYASNGQEAVTLREQNEYDIIFMDIQMPVMNGVDASKAIRKFESEKKLSAVPIIALTANTGKDDRDEYLDAGMTDYMAKPIMIEDVRKRIAQL